MFLFLFTFFNLIGFAQTNNIEPVVIEAEDPELVSPRSSSWPASHLDLEETFIQPQLDNKLNSLPGVQARLYQGSPTISIRGSAQSGRVLSLYNDIPLNFATGFGAPIVLLPKEVIGSTQIIKGPASLFYGSQAMAGSVNFLSRKIDSPFLRMTASDTDNSYLPWTTGGVAHNNFTLGSPIYSSKKNHVQATLFTENDDGQFPYNKKNSSAVRENNNQNTNRLTLLGQHKFKHWNLGYDIVAGSLRRQTPGALSFPLVTDEDTKAYLISLSPEFYLSKYLLVKTKPSFIKVDSNFKDPSFGENFNKQETFILQNTFNVFAEESLNLQFFADYFQHKLNSSFNPKSLDDDNFEVGLHSEFFFHSNWYVQGGARYLLKDEKAIPHIGLFYQRSSFKSWVSFSEGFRKATLSDRFASAFNYIANPNLNPETSTQYELGVQWGSMAFKKPTTFANRWKIETRAFYIDYDNFIERTTLTNPTFTKNNAGEGESYGGEFFAQFGYGPWELFVNYSFLEARSKQTKETFLLSPKHQLTWGFFHFVGPLKIEVQNSFWKNYYDRDPFNNNQLVKLDDWSQWNLLFHSYSFRAINFSIGVLNLFNENKELTLNYPEPQRRFWAQATWEF